MAKSTLRTNKREQYKLSHKKEKNKIRKLKAYLKIHPHNLIAVDRIKQLEGVIKNGK
jgi:hypothetical protein